VSLLPGDIVSLALIGLVAGVLGGMLGIGGSVIMIPGMTIVFAGRPWDEQHLYQASAMIVNVAVAVPATLRHRRAGALNRRTVWLLVPPVFLLIIAGVLVSNALDGAVLKRIFAVFLLYVVGANVWRLVRANTRSAAARARARPERTRLPVPHAWGIGGSTGFMSGLLGIGGGIVTVPLLTTVARLPLRPAIAASAAVMCITAGFGAILKVATLDQFGRSGAEAVVIALVLAPTAMLGGFLGAGLTHALPLGLVRGVFALLMLIVAARMGGVI